MPASYEAAIPPAISTATFEITPELMLIIEDATVAITRFDAEVSASFGAEIAPMSSILLRTEATSSSKIENLTAGAKQISLAELGVESSTNAKLIAANVTAMKAAVQLADNIDMSTILAMHKALLLEHVPAIAGKWRNEQVWIGTDSLSPAGALFVPPHQSRVVPAIADLVSFLQRIDLPVLAQAAIAHAQFETIHPFSDGNGRTGRALLHAWLKHAGLTRYVTVPISAGLLANTRAYFDALTAFHDGDIGPIVTQVAEAAQIAASRGRALVMQLADLRADWNTRISSRAGSAGRSLLPILISQPALNVAYVQQQLSLSAMSATNAITQAVDANILVPISDKKRNRVWIAKEVIAVMDEFAAATERRYGFNG